METMKLFGGLTREKLQEEVEFGKAQFNHNNALSLDEAANYDRFFEVLTRAEYLRSMICYAAVCGFTELKCEYI